MIATRVWRLKSAHVDELVRAEDQWAAWDSLRDRPLADFGLVTIAEPGEDPEAAVMIRTSALLFRWGRDDEAEAACDYAVTQGLPDTREVDRT